MKTHTTITLALVQAHEGPIKNRYCIIVTIINGPSAQITAHASVADIPVSNVKDLNLNQGDTIGPSSLCLCVTHNVFGMT